MVVFCVVIIDCSSLGPGMYCQALQSKLANEDLAMREQDPSVQDFTGRCETRPDRSNPLNGLIEGNPITTVFDWSMGTRLLVYEESQATTG